MWVWKRNCKSYSYTLYSGQSPVGYRPWVIRCSVDLSKNCKGGLNLLEGPFWGEEKEKEMEIHPVVYFLDGLEGNE